jgi:5-methylcytosine-specific restriction endonuclease McrA
MARDAVGFVCRGSCHRAGSLQSFEVHHVWPQEFHGPTRPDNLVKICANCHSNTHDLLNRMLRGKPYVLASYSPTERQLAQRGHDAIMAYGESLSPPGDPLATRA